MPIKKRGNIWHVHFTKPNGEVVRLSANTENRQAAQEYHDDLKRRAWRDDKLGDKLTKTWEHACLRWFEEKVAKKSIEDDKSRAKWLTKHLSGMFLNDITFDIIQDIAKKKKKESSPATANRHLQLLRAILNRAEKEWGWLDRAPYIKLYPEKARRIRWLTHDQARTLLNELPPHLKALATLALCTGQRRANVMNLEWSQVDLKRKIILIHGDLSKNEKPVGVPLNDSAIEVLEALKGNHDTHVITYRGKPIQQASTRAWYNAMKRAGITDFRFHDLRHTWASWMIQNGVPLIDLQELGNWKDSSMVRKYAHLDVTHLQKHANGLPKL
ncbi:site-specific integrase [Methylotenera sp.]|uniref:tyrosine-type recombinase/integrase n=1 Tax=Methylotenera sp. TaxID=2051956 RepID=UPI002488C9C8|nr:site-specific integrase [Methylotenera sp.]MDI1360623.1 tyrosine-type recombinase/integrase [Methylotenera sp.]